MVATLTNPDLPTLSREDEHLLLRYMHHKEKLDPLAAELASQSSALSPPPSQPDQGLRTEDSGPSSSPSPHLPIPQSPPPFPHTPLSLLTWTASPRIKPYIRLYQDHISHLDRREAIDTLKEIIRATEDLIEKRRAASSMLRLLQNRGAQAPGAPRGPGPRNSSRVSRHPVNESLDEDDTLIDEADDAEGSDIENAADTEADGPSEDSGPRTQDSGLSSPPLPTPHSSLPTTLSNPNPWAPYHPKNFFPIIPITDAYADKPGQIDSVPHAPLPDPCREPSDVALLVLKAIQTPDEPTDGAGPRILFNLQGYIRDRSLEAFNEYKNNYLKNVVGHAWNHAAAELFPLSADEESCKFLAELTLADNSHAKFRIQLERIPAGTLKECWVIRHLYFDYDSARSQNTSKGPPVVAADP